MSNDQTRNRPTISIVTATYNAAKHLPALIESLRAQSDKDFQWVVADGASDDGTLELLRSVTDINIVISSQADFGIYDALNRAIKIASGDYYIVCGADDVFYSDAIANFRRAIDQSGADIVVADAMYGKQRMKVKNGPSWLFGSSAFIAMHALATAFKKDLHCTYGIYSRDYPIAADQLFIIRACEGGARRYEGGFVAGEIGRGGVSSVDYVGSATEVFRVQIEMGHSMAIQMLILVIRLLVNSVGRSRAGNGE